MSQPKRRRTERQPSASNHFSAAFPPGTLFTGASHFKIRRPVTVGRPSTNMLGSRLDSYRQGKSQSMCASDEATLHGLVVPYDRTDALDNSGLETLFKRGCFTQSLQNNDLRLTFNFNPMRILGRQSAGTVHFYDAPDGLYFECIPPSSSWASDLLISIQRKDIRGTGAAFRSIREHREKRDGRDVRVIDLADLYAVAVSSFSVFDAGLMFDAGLDTTPDPDQPCDPDDLTATAMTPRDREFLKTMGIQSRSLR
jgi:HK97 family phage prohead protease